MTTVAFATPTDLDEVYITKKPITNKIGLKQRKVRLVFVLGGDLHEVATGDALTIAAPEGFTLEEVKASVKGTSATPVVFGVTVGGVSILSTPLSIDGSEKHSSTATAPAVISITSVAEDAEIVVSVTDQGDGNATGAVVYLLGKVTNPS